MRHEVKKYLRDIQIALENTLSFLPAETSFEAFCQDIKTQYAVERGISIVGEAMYQMLKIEPEVEISDADKIAKTRHILVHAYDQVDEEILWTIITEHLDTLKQEVDALLNT